MSYTPDLLDGLALLLAAAGIGTYAPTGVYLSTDTGITVGVMPDTPDTCLCLTPYPVEDTGTTDVTTGVQIRIRGGSDPRVIEALADAVYDELHNRTGYLLGPVYVAVSWRQSQAQLGQDLTGRCELAANYYLRATRPFPNAYE